MIRELAEQAVERLKGPKEALGGKIESIERMPDERQVLFTCYLYRAILDNGYWVPFAVPKTPPTTAEKKTGVHGSWCRRCGNAVDLGREHHFFGAYGLVHWSEEDCLMSKDLTK